MVGLGLAQVGMEAHPDQPGQGLPPPVADLDEGLFGLVQQLPHAGEVTHAHALQGTRVSAMAASLRRPSSWKVSRLSWAAAIDAAVGLKASTRARASSPRARSKVGRSS